MAPRHKRGDAGIEYAQVKPKVFPLSEKYSQQDILREERRGQRNIHITFIKLYCYNCFVSLFVIVNLLLCLIISYTLS